MPRQSRRKKTLIANGYVSMTQWGMRDLETDYAILPCPKWDEAQQNYYTYVEGSHSIAGVLAMKPECIVLDEATAMLDPVGRREVLAAVEKLNYEQGITVVLITHHMNEAEHADRVIVMNDGLVVMDGTPREVFTRKKELEDIGLAVPDTVSLLFSLREAGMDVPTDAITVKECADAIMKNFT